MTNNAKIGGVLSIVAGAFGVLGLLFFVAMAVIMMVIPASFEASSYDYTYSTSGDYDVLIVVAIFYLVIGIFIALIGVLSIVGGVFALRKKYWGWALAGAISANLIFPLCGIPATIFVALGKSEFDGAAPPENAPMETIVG